tara:strand:+ start:439 stop:993 length:555 start_codon:yes stop_codon:yes gene_type:complete
LELLKEVAPPGFGHTKSGKGDKKGGTAAAFDRARKEGRFKGSKSDMFAIMWAMKNKGVKPQYKPGTKKKYKKYQEETSMPNVDKKDRGAIKKRFKGLFKKDIKGTVAGVNENAEVTGGFEFQDYDPNMKFRDYEFIDIIKAEPLKGAVSEGSDYEKLKKKIGSKEKHDKPVMTFKEFKYLNKYT